MKSQLKAYFPLDDFVRANRQKSRNASYLLSRRIFSPANFNQSRCRIPVFASRRTNKVAKWKIGLRELSREFTHDMLKTSLERVHQLLALLNGYAPVNRYKRCPENL